MTERQPDHRCPREGAIPLVGRCYEVDALASAMYRHVSRLITGPNGMGKTRLINEALALARPRSVLLGRPEVLHALLEEMARQLSCWPSQFEKQRRATSAALKFAVQQTLRKEPRCIVLEDVSGADPRMYRFLQEIYHIPGASLIVTATSRANLGFLHKLLWDPREEIVLEPLNRPESLRMFELAADLFGLRALDLDDFRPKVLKAACGNPGQIATMCRMAGKSEYQDGRHIKFLPLRMDALMELA